MSFLRSLLVLLMMVVVVSGCSRRKVLSKVWFYTYDGSTDKTEAADLVLTPVDFVNLQPDGEYTAHFGRFEVGKWELDGKYIVLKSTDKSSDKKVTHLKLEHIDKNEIILDIQPENRYISSYHFEGTETGATNTVNPFSKENNLWRIKATHKESDQEITARLKNHFRYWEKYFEWGIKEDKKTLDVRSLPGPLKMYGNGFELVPLEDWAPEWKSNFYDIEDCRIAYNKLHYFFTYERIAWAKTDHKFKMFVSAFQQLQQKID
jgi:hypothetical protein